MFETEFLDACRAEKSWHQFIFTDSDYLAFTNDRTMCPHSGLLRNLLL